VGAAAPARWGGLQTLATPLKAIAAPAAGLIGVNFDLLRG
jgi:hypothetical protein